MTNTTNIAAVPRAGAASFCLTVAAAFSETDLTGVSDYPDHAAQLVDVKNTGSSDETVAWVDYRGVSHSRVLSAGESYPIEIPVATLLASSGDSIMATCYWWPASGSGRNS